MKRSYAAVRPLTKPVDRTASFYKEDGTLIATIPIPNTGTSHGQRNDLAYMYGIFDYHHVEIGGSMDFLKRYDKKWTWYRLNEDGTLGEPSTFSEEDREEEFQKPFDMSV